MNSMEVLFTPADFEGLKTRDLQESACVVFDVLRATSSMLAALANGALGIIPVAEIAEAVAMHERDPKIVLAGERDGLLIPPGLAGGVAFHLGNSPREFSCETVEGRIVVMTTTNGTRALRACVGARSVLVASFSNLRATAFWLRSLGPRNLLVVCGGTFDQAAYEDTLAAGALCDLVADMCSHSAIADSVLMSRELFSAQKHDVAGAISRGRNGRRLLSRPQLAGDVEFSSQLDTLDFAAVLGRDGIVRRAA